MVRPYIPTSKIGYYAQRVLKGLESMEPPIQVDPILEYFGLELRLFNPQYITQIPRFRRFRNIELPAFLDYNQDKPTIYIEESNNIPRQRLSVFHECGHFDIPWHRGKSYFCECIFRDSKSVSRYEREAFAYASSIMFPFQTFNEDIKSMPIGIKTLHQLSERYQASFEATSIKYISSNPGQCAVVYLTENTSGNAIEFPYRVKYSIVSSNFHRFWAPRKLVKHHYDLERCFREKKNILTEIPATVFGSTKKHSYIADLRPYGPDRVCVLLNIPVKQISCL